VTVWDGIAGLRCQGLAGGDLTGQGEPFALVLSRDAGIDGRKALAIEMRGGGLP